MKHKRISNNAKQRQQQTKFLQEQTKRMEDRLKELKRHVEEQKQLKASTNYESTISKWKKAVNTDAPLKSYAKKVLEQQKQVFKKFGVDQKKITGTKTFSSIKKKIKDDQVQAEEKNPTKIDFLLKSQQSSKSSVSQLPVETIQNNFFKAKMNVKDLIKEKTVLQFLEEIFLQQYWKTFEAHNITELGDLRFISQDQLEQMGLAKGHQIKVMKKIKEEFEKQHSPSKFIKVEENSPQKKSQEETLPKSQEKVMVEMGYGEGNVNDYAQIERKQAQNFNLEEQSVVNSESQQEKDDVVLLTIPPPQMSEIALQTGQVQVLKPEKYSDDYSEKQGPEQKHFEIAENCFNCYRAIALGESYTSPDLRQFCSANCLKMYKLEMQKSCPKCDETFFRTQGFYQEGMWFCSIGCCPNKEQIDEMFLDWAGSAKR